MKTFTTIKKRIEKYKNEIELLQNSIIKEQNTLLSEIYDYFSETKFIRTTTPNGRNYYYLSSLEYDTSKFVGVKLSYGGKLEYGRLSLIELMEAEEYESIVPDVFFRKLKSFGVSLEKYSDSVLVECNKYKPIVVHEIDDSTTKCVGYCRLSNDSKVKNGYQRQMSEINHFADKKNYLVSDFFTETISGTINMKERKITSDLIEYCKLNEIKSIMISDITRIGRTETVIMNSISYLLKNGIENILLVKEDIIINEEYLTEHYRQLKQLAKTSESEYESIRHRMKEGYMSYVEKRKENPSAYPMGRPSTYKKPMENYLQQYQKEIDLLRKNLSLRQVYTITGTAVGTLRKLANMFKDEFPELNKRRRETVPSIQNN